MTGPTVHVMVHQCWKQRYCPNFRKTQLFDQGNACPIEAGTDSTQFQRAEKKLQFFSPVFPSPEQWLLFILLYRLNEIKNIQIV